MALWTALAPLGPSLTTLLDVMLSSFLACWVGVQGGYAPVAPQLISCWGYFQTWIVIMRPYRSITAEKSIRLCDLGELTKDGYESCAGQQDPYAMSWGSEIQVNIRSFG